MKTPTCPKCNSSMELGALLDRGHGDQLNTTDWLEGAPEKSFWSGVKTKGKERFEVQTYRCSRCGYLESYAHPKE